MGLLIELLLETPLFLREEVQAIVPDLGQTDPLYDFTARGKGVVCLLALTCDAPPGALARVPRRWAFRVPPRRSAT